MSPPRLAEWLLARVVPRGVVGESIVGDMREAFADSLARRGRARARAEYWSDVLRIWMSLAGPGEARRGEAPSGTARGTSSAGRPPGRRGPSFAFLTRDLRFVIRGLIKSPGFTFATVLCLALGIGANSAIFSVIRGVLLRELPFANPDELVLLRAYDAEHGAEDALSLGTRSVSYLDGQDWVGSESMADVALLDLADYKMHGAALPEQIPGAPVTPNLFALLGATPELGQVFGPDETRAVVVLSHAIWQRTFGGSPDVIGKVIRLNDLPFEIVGVMPPSFRVPPTDAELWLPIDAAPTDAAGRHKRATREWGTLNAIGRLSPGSTPALAEAELGPLTTRIHKENPDPPNDCQFGCSGDPPTLVWGVLAVPLQELLVGHVRSTLFLLMGAVTLLLIISSVNVTGLMVARLTARQHALAVHASLGAGRFRVALQLLAESVVLSVLGGASGLLLALGLVRVIKVVSPGDIPRLSEVTLDPAVIAFTAAVSLSVAVLCGIALAVASLKASEGDLLRVKRITGAKSGTRFRQSLVVAEVALTSVLVLGAGLLVNSFRYLWTYDTGYDPRGVLTAAVRPSGARYSYDTGERNWGAVDVLFDQLVERLEAHPGVEAVGTVNRLPEDRSGLVLMTSTQPLERGQEPRRSIPYRDASPAFFEALRIPLVEGRMYDGGEYNVAVVNETLAKDLWPGESAVGQRIYTEQRVVVEVVGVVRDQKKSALDPIPQPELYMPGAIRVARGGRIVAFEITADTGGPMAFNTRSLVIRTKGDPEAFIPTLRETLRDLDPELPLLDVRTMDQVLEQSLARPRFYMALFTGFGVVALILSAAGIFGVASYTVTQRQQEVGVRIALGARGLDVLRAVVGTGALLTGGGIIAGLIAARWLTRFLDGVLYGIQPNDPRTFAAVAGLLALVAISAFWIPARRATKVDPIGALKAE